VPCGERIEPTNSPGASGHASKLTVCTRTVSPQLVANPVKDLCKGP
jgi:hypothetical protein